MVTTTVSLSLSTTTADNRYIRNNNRANPLLQSPKYSLPHSVAICAIQKGGKPYLEEWIDYYRLLGFDMIYLYDNSADHELKNWTYQNDMLNVVHFPGPKKQLKAYRHCAARIQQEGLHSWVAFFDLDEFLVLHKHQYIFEFLDDMIEQHARNQNNKKNDKRSDVLGGIAINWFMFDYNNQTNYEPLPLTLRFQRRELAVNQHVKTIVNMAQYRKAISPHAFSYRDRHAVAVDTSGNVLQPPTWFHANGPTDVAALHHMSVKSVEEYHQRCARGRADVVERTRKKNYDPPFYCRSEEEILDNFQRLAAANSAADNLVVDAAAWRLLVEGMPEKYAKNWW
jgi:Glycosyl transferase family 2